MKVYENPVGVLTNNPPFETQMFLLNNYMNLSAKQPENHFAKQIPLADIQPWHGRTGTSGRSVFGIHALREWHLRSFIPFPDESEEESVGQFFHILGSVDQQRGCCEVAEGKYEITIYTSCWNAQRGNLLLYDVHRAPDHGG